MTIEIGIIEDHPAMLLGTVAILHKSDDIRVVAHGTTAAAVVRHGGPLHVVLLDLSLADGTGPAENIQALAPLGAPIIAYTSGERPHLIREAARAGASGMIRKSDRIDLIADAVRRAARGEIVASADWAAALESDREFVSAQLSPRESEVLSLYASGETAKQVAQLLYLSPETIIDHVRRIRAKYAAVDRAAPTKVDLFRRAVEDGLVSPER
ncbi:LuxR C-terminal-related transcriptional regulator [Microbacterium sp. NPDC087591]|uniref:response regulator transcription factor n=1 Tax=Microbacterium sp. NPDC087591 TaxID=3364192 RepID=UPI0037FED1A5